MRAILCICALALFCEAAIGTPYVDADDEFDDALDMTKRVADILSPSTHHLGKRPVNCPLDCFSCAKFIRDVIPDPCVRGCRKETDSPTYTTDLETWYRCAQFLSRPR
ncbi:uncharacterized protein LOC119742165 [Patiria miniata]|uniref:Uncharacterized protein n=1 Tax=Patiria miniata TaxID=46514 RepID=A0A914BDJ9_PATMI|nr:uncharacterized protein LOC119742165 [Patiria miniata]